jgi:trehalose 6-phosphate synthase
VAYARDATGRRITSRGSGGLVTALRALIDRGKVTWIASALSDEDRAVAAEGTIEETSREGSRYRLRLVVHEPDTYEAFYNVVANPTLWFVQHALLDELAEPQLGAAFERAWDEGYAAVNASFAHAVLDELERQPDAAVFFQDYHLYLAPWLVRERAPEAALMHFVHIPWQEPAAWRALPERVRVAIHDSLLANDVVGFHTQRWRRAFLDCCEAFLNGDVHEDELVEHAGRTTRVTAHPISPDPAEFRALAGSAQVLAAEQRLLAERPELLVLRVDRTDPSKNIVRGFEAYGLLLARHPELHGRVQFLALLDPSRQEIPEYVEHAATIERAAGAVNERFGRDGWEPVVLRVEDDFAASLAAYKQYDALLVNPVFDGLNLVAKEAPLVNERDGVLVLSENAGANEELGDLAVSVDPFDVEAQAGALHEALTMSPGERRRRLDGIRSQVVEHDLAAWLAAQLADLDAATSTIAP